MIVKQISVFIENEAGRLAEITDLLCKNGISIRALSLADTTKFGILRLIVDKPDDAERHLKEAGMTVAITEVIAVPIVDQPGGLTQVLNVLESQGIAVEYVYAFVGSHEGNAYVILRVEDNQKAISLLVENGIHPLCLSDIINI